jgi:hypothetical protein
VQVRQFFAIWWRIGLELTLALVILGDLLYGNLIVPFLIYTLRSDQYAFSYGITNLFTLGFVASTALGFFSGLILALVSTFVVRPDHPRYWPTMRGVLAVTILIPVILRFIYGSGYFDALVQRQPIPWLVDLVLTGYNATEINIVGPFLLTLIPCLEIAAWIAISAYRAHILRTAINSSQ